MNNLSLPTAFSLPTDRVLIGVPANWNAETKWVDRDTLPIPSTEQELVFGMRKVIRGWFDKRPVDILEHLDVDKENAKIPRPWPAGLNGQEEPPFAVHYVVYFCNSQGSIYTFCNKTFGAKIAYERLEEQIAVVSGLRKMRVAPVILLEQRPMPTRNFGLKARPHFNVVDWKELDGDSADDNAQQSMPQAPAPQLSGPAGAAAPAPQPTQSVAPATAPQSPPASETKAVSTLDQMKSAKPVTVGDIINDELPPWA